MGRDWFARQALSGDVLPIQEMKNLKSEESPRDDFYNGHARFFTQNARLYSILASKLFSGMVSIVEKRSSLRIDLVTTYSVVIARRKIELFPALR
jgi:hypothetical protein